ncbi:oligosaccharide flippase family protein [Eggerthellaceae bacterium 24-137]
MQLKSLGRNIAIMGFGTILAQSINVLVQPLLTRLFPVEDLGIYTFVISIANIIIPIASLKLDLLIISEKDELRAQYITDVCIFINFFIAAASLVFLIGADLLYPSCVLFQYGRIVYLVPLLVLTNGLRFLFISYNNRYMQYKLISKLGIIREGARAVLQVLSGVLHLGPIGLIAGYAVSPIFGYRLQIKSYLEGRKKRKAITRRQFKDILLNTGRKQLLFIMPAQLVNSFSSSITTLMIGSLFSPVALGYYSMGVRVLDTPIIFIASNVSKVCYQKICDNISHESKVLPVVLPVMGILSIISVASFGLLYLIAIPFCQFLFGDSYAIAGAYIQCLCLMYGTRLVATSFAGAFTAFKRQSYELILNISLIVCIALAFLIARLSSASIEVFLTIVSAGYSLIYATMAIAVIACCVHHDSSLGKTGTEKSATDD